MRKESGAPCTAAPFLLFVMYTRFVLCLPSLCFLLVLTIVVMGGFSELLLLAHTPSLLHPVFHFHFTTSRNN